MLSQGLSNTDRLGALTASPASLFQALSSLSLAKEMFSSSQVPTSPDARTFEPFPRALAAGAREKSSAPPAPPPLLRKLERAGTSSLSLLLSKPEKKNVSSAAPQRTGLPAPSPALLPSSGRIQASSHPFSTVTPQLTALHPPQHGDAITVALADSFRMC